MTIETSTLVLPDAWDDDTPEGRELREVVDFVAAVRERLCNTRAVAQSPAETLGLVRGGPSRRVRVHVARDGGRVVGRSVWSMSELEEVTMIEGGWDADTTLPPDVRRAVAEALLDAVEALSAAEGRPWLLIEAPCEPGLLVPTSGAGGVDPDAPDSAALLARGFVLEQVYRYQLADLTKLDDLDARMAAAPADGYRVVSWAGRVPDEHRAGWCAMAGLMAQEVPSGGVEFEVQVWDESRLSEFEATMEAAGRVAIGALAYTDAGEPAGYTELFVTEGEVARQGDTMVAPAYRGHGLGRWLKLTTLDRLRSGFPGRRYVTTDNAEENAQMLAINEAIGFRTVTREGLWQRRPTSEDAPDAA